MRADLIKLIADAIEREEGFNAPGQSRARRNNNPGNLWDGLSPGKKRRIWPGYPIDDQGFLLLPEYAVGRRLMQDQISRKILRGETLRELINQWDGSDAQAKRDMYVDNVAAWTGLPTDTPLRSV